MAPEAKLAKLKAARNKRKKKPGELTDLMLALAVLMMTKLLNLRIYEKKLSSCGERYN